MTYRAYEDPSQVETERLFEFLLEQGSDAVVIAEIRGRLASAAQALTALSGRVGEVERPGHTDLMVTPESLGPWLEKNEAARIICDFMGWPEDGPAWDDAHKLAAKLRATTSPRDHDHTAGVKLEGWQPIGTAPKDGTHILIWNGEGDGFEIGYWVEREEDGSDQPGHDAGWFGYTFAFPGRSWGARLRSEPQGQPTHWQPLPEAPEVGS